MGSPVDVSVSDARGRLASLIEQSTVDRAPVYLSRRGRRVAAIVDVDVLAHVLELAEDMEDVLAAEVSRRELAELRHAPVPWDEVKAELGL